MTKRKSAAAPAGRPGRRQDELATGEHIKPNITQKSAAVNDVVNDSIATKSGNVKAPVSVFSSKNPQVITKSFRLSGGKLEKIRGGAMARGSVETKHVDAIELGELIARLGPDQALAFGVCGHDSAAVVTKGQLAESREHTDGLPVIARNKGFFCYPAGPAWLFVDYDPVRGTAPMTDRELLAHIIEAVPALKAAPTVMIDSASSHIHNGDAELIGAGGHHVYFQVENGQDIPRAGEVLFKRLQLKGHARYEISRAGTLLQRSLIDESVFQPSRLDFAGGADVEQPLVQKRPAPRNINAGAEPLDTEAAIPDLTPEEEAILDALLVKLKDEIRPEAEAQREVWIAERVAAGLAKMGMTEEANPEEAKTLRAEYEAACRDSKLLGDFELQLADGTMVTVAQMLDDKDRYHGKYCHDPLEPEYCNNSRVAWINLRSAGRPYIHSHAHGGRRFTLHRQRREVRWSQGNRVAIIEECLELMRLDGGVFDRGGELVRVDGSGKVHPLDQAGLLLHLDRIVQMVKWNIRANAWMPFDCPPPVADGILSMRGQWGLPELISTSTAPTMDLGTGRVVDQDGHDSATGTLLVLGDLAGWRGVPARPGSEDLSQAVRTLWTPFELFPFVGPVDRGVFLAALLTTVVRSMLPTAPGFSITASTAGSGKTLLAKSLAALSGRQAALMSAAKEEDELRKRLLALGRSGANVIVLDNLTGMFSSECLCAWLTSETYTDRILGATQTVTVPTRNVLILTGNNVLLKGDLCRRVLTCRIDAEMETPWKRSFEIDPVAYIREHRLELVRAALIIIKAATDAPAPPDRTASFEMWSDTIRRAVLNVANEGLMDVEDPMLAVDKAYSLDPETVKLARVLDAWTAAFGDKAVTISEAARGHLFAEDGALGAELRDALWDVAGQGHEINARQLAAWVVRQEDRRVGGHYFKRSGIKHKVVTWQVVAENTEECLRRSSGA